MLSSGLAWKPLALSNGLSSCVLYRLSKILDLDLGPLLIAEVLFSNVGGTATGNVVCVCVLY